MNETPPSEVMERAFTRLARGHLVKAVKPFRSGEYPLEVLQPALGETAARLYARGGFGEILSAYFRVGVFSSIEVKNLIRGLYATRDFPAFLKQVYRFDALDDFPDEVQTVLEWHRSRHLPDAEAWSRKFKKLTEQRDLSRAESQSIAAVQVLDEECVDVPIIPTRTFTLHPLRTSCRRSAIPLADADKTDPYIVSRTARCKLERATREHERTLAVLSNFLSSKGIPTAANQLIDAFAELPSGPAMFEVKSINSDNERDQVRHAISQLYEYRFLHGVAHATLWVVFSQPPDSEWILEYLTNDRGINVLWTHQDQLCGHSIDKLLRVPERRGDRANQVPEDTTRKFAAPDR